MTKASELLKPFSKENPKPDPKELFFCCPECGESELSLTMTGVRLIRDVNRVYKDGRVELGEPFDDEVYGIFYECSVCEYRLRDDSGNSVGTDDVLVKWLQEHSKEHGRKRQ